MMSSDDNIKHQQTIIQDNKQHTANRKAHLYNQ